MSEYSKRKTQWLVHGFTLILAALGIGVISGVPETFAQTLTPTPIGGGHGQIAFTSDSDTSYGVYQIYIMNSDGSDVRRLTDSNVDEGVPQWSPDGMTLAFERNTGPDVIDKKLEIDVYDIFLMDADGSHIRRLSQHAFEDNYQWSPDDTQIALQSHRDLVKGIYTLPLDSSFHNLTGSSSNSEFPTWSPDGKQIAFASDRDGNWEIYVMEADGSNVRRLTNKAAEDSFPVWSPDGTRIAFGTNRDGNFEIYTMRADGTNQRNLTRNRAADRLYSWSPDGSKIVFASSRHGADQLYVMDADGSDVRPLTDNTGQSSGDPTWSPDGTQLAFVYMHDEPEIYVVNADGSNLHRIHTGDSESPAWRP